MSNLNPTVVVIVVIAAVATAAVISVSGLPSVIEQAFDVSPSPSATPQQTPSPTPQPSLTIVPLDYSVASSGFSN